MNPRTWLRPRWHWLLALLMLLSQQAALRHSLEHGPGNVDHALHTQCVSCLAFHAVDHAAPAPVAVMAAEAGAPPALPSVQVEARPAVTVTGFLARAPPLSIS